VVSITDVMELLEGRGRRPREAEERTVFNVVLERFMDELDIEYSDLRRQNRRHGHTVRARCS
jgi:hypothetical protein